MNLKNALRIKHLTPFLLPVIINLLPAFLVETSAADTIIKQWTIEDHLPQNTINTLLQTSDGFLWIGTPSGLVRFDGIKFKYFTRSSTKIFSSENITALSEDRQNTLWIGTRDGGLYSFHRGIWSNYSRKSGLSNNHVRAIISDWQNNLWVGTDFGLNRITDNNIRTFTDNDGLPGNIITALEIDLNGNLWIATLQGQLCKFSESVFQIYGAKEGLTCPSVTALKCDHDGTLWIGSIDGLYQKAWNEETISYVRSSSYLPVTSITENNQGELLIGTLNSGIQKLKNARLVDYSPAINLPDNFIRCLVHDHNDRLWIGTDIAGLIRLKPRLVQNLSCDQDLPDNLITTLLFSNDGTLWIGSRDSGLCCLDHRQALTIFNKDTKLNGKTITALYQDSNRQLWIGTRQAGIFHYRNGKIYQFNHNNKLASQQITVITCDNNKTFWIGTDKGLNRFADNIVTQITELSGIQINVLMSHNNNMFIGTQTGLFQLHETTLNKIIPEESESNIEINSLFMDSSDVLWIGSNGFGLSRLKNDSLKTIDTDDNFFSNYIFNINEDKNGYLWFSSYEGVFAYSRQELNACLDGMSRLPSAIFFNESEGMGSRQCTNIGQPSMAKSPDGNIYVATIQGISVIDPDIIFSSDSLPVSIENLMVDGVSLDLFKPIEISPRFGTLRIDFTATDFTAPEKIHFWYQLEGFDQEIHYMKPGSQRSVSYTGLKPEKYRFILEARQNAATEIVNSCSLDFTIKKPFYRKPIFIAGIILLTVAAGIISQSVMRRNIQEPVKYSTSSLTTEKISSVLPALSDLMENNKEYLNPDLTLVELSKKLHISPNHLSQIINTNFGLNFNDYLNQYRIHEAQRQLSSSELKSKSILEIMFDSGFNSKSVFNTAFKKITGTTPSAYRNKQ